MPGMGLSKRTAMFGGVGLLILGLVFYLFYLADVLPRTVAVFPALILGIFGLVCIVMGEIAPHPGQSKA